MWLSQRFPRQASTFAPSCSAPYSWVHQKQGHHTLDRRNARHLLRHLLRECTYLPDATSRVHLKHHILRRFRMYSDVATPASSVPTPRILAKLREGRRALLALRKANQGYFLQVNKILHHTYGRTGRRSRQLLKPLRCIDDVNGTSCNNIVSTVLLKHPTTLPSSVAGSIPYLTRPLETLYLEQQRRSRFLDKSLKLSKHRGPEITLLNAWRRPLPPCRVKNQVKRWYAEVLSKILPPLPAAEWTALHGLSHGSLSSDLARVNQRRVMIGTNTPPIFTTRHLELELDLLAQHSVSSSGGRKQPHRITRRFMRRRWTNVLANSPCLTLDEPLDRWDVKWATREHFPREKQLTDSLRTALIGDGEQ